MAYHAQIHKILERRHCYLPVCPQRITGTGHICLQQQLTADTEELFTTHSKTEKKKKQKTKVGGDLWVCVLNLLLEVSTLTGFMAKSLVKMEIYFSNLSCNLTLVKELCDFKGRTVFLQVDLICQMTSQDHIMSCNSMGGSS